VTVPDDALPAGAFAVTPPPMSTLASSETIVVSTMSAAGFVSFTTGTS